MLRDARSTQAKPKTMNATVDAIPGHSQQSFVLPPHEQRRWYAAYTCANHEKRVADLMRARELEHFLPLYTSVRRWKDRGMVLQMPLFPGYVFVRIALRDRLQVQQVPGVAWLVGFDATPAPLPDEEIQALRASLSTEARIEPHPYMTAGRRVRIKTGCLAGMEGVLLRRKGNFRVVISVELIRRSLAIDINECDLEPLRLPAADRR